MWGPNAVAIETVLRHREANLHSIGSRLGVTGPAVEQGISVDRAAHRLDVIAVGEPQVGWWRSGGRPPADGFLDDPVVAVGTRGWLGPGCFGLVLYTGMTAGALGEEVTVLPVIEAILRLGVATLEQDQHGKERRQQPASRDHDPARGRVLIARGRGTWSAPLPKSSVTRAFSRV
jgi:hypothetical protein